MKNGNSLRRIILCSTSLVWIGTASAWAVPPVVVNATTNQSLDFWTVEQHDVTNNSTDPLAFVINRDLEVRNLNFVSSVGSFDVISIPTDVTGFDLDVDITLNQSILDGNVLSITDGSIDSDFDELSASIIVDEDTSLENDAQFEQSSNKNLTSTGGNVAGGDASIYDTANQSAQFGSEILIESNGTDDVEADISSEADRYASNALLFSLNTADTRTAGTSGNIVAGDMDVEIHGTQHAGIDAEIEITSSGDLEVYGDIANDGNTVVMNYSNGNLTAFQSSFAGGLVLPGNVVQVVDIDQAANVLNAITIVTDGDDAAGGNIVNTGVNVATNYSGSDLYSLLNNGSGFDGITVDVVEQSVTVRQAADIRNEITIEVGDEAFAGGFILNQGLNFAGNYAGGNVYSWQSNFAAGNLSAGDVEQSLDTQQTATIWNEITLDSGEGGFDAGEIINAGENQSANYVYGNIAAYQSDHTINGDIDAGNVAQSLTNDQTATVWNGFNIDTGDYSLVYGGIGNYGIVLAVNSASGNLASFQNGGGPDFEAGDVDQDISSEQSAIVWNGIDIETGDGTGIRTGIRNDGYAVAYNAEYDRLSAYQGFLTDDGLAGDVDQSLSIDQTAVLWNGIEAHIGESYIGAYLYNEGDQIAYNLAAGNVVSVQGQGVFSGNLVAGGVSQNLMFDQSAGISNVIEITAGYDEFEIAGIGNSGNLTAANEAYSNLVSEQTNSGGEGIFAGNVDQTSAIAQYAGVANDIVISSGEDLGVRLYSDNEGNIYAANFARSTLSSSTENEGESSRYIFGGDVVQSSTLDQIAVASDEIEISATDSAYSFKLDQLDPDFDGSTAAVNAAASELSSDWSNDEAFGALGADVDQESAISQYAAVNKNVIISAGEDVFGLVLEVNNEPQAAFNKASAGLSSVKDTGNVYLGFSGNVDQSSITSQIASVWTGIGIEAGEELSSYSAIGNFSASDAVNTSKTVLESVESGHGLIVFSGEDDQSAVTFQLAGIGNSLAVIGDDVYGRRGIENRGILTAQNSGMNSVFSNRHNQSLVSGTVPFLPFSSDVNQSSEIGQLAVVLNTDLELAGSYLDADTTILNNGELVAENRAGAELTSLKSNLGFSPVLGNVTQVSTIGQTAGIVNDIVISAGEELESRPQILNGNGYLGATNNAWFNMLASEQNQGNILAFAGDVIQSGDMNQYAMVSNDITVDGGDDTYVYADISNGYVYSQNTGGVELTSVQKNQGGQLAFYGDVDQSFTTDQLAGMSNMIGIESEGGTWAVPTISNLGFFLANNQSTGLLTADQGQLGGIAALAGNVDQSVSVHQAAGFWNAIEVDGNGGGSVDPFITNSGEFEVYNEAAFVLMNEQENAAGDTVESGDVSQSVTIEQYATLRNGIYVDSHDGSSEWGISAIIVNAGEIDVHNQSYVGIASQQHNDAYDITVGNIQQDVSVQQTAVIWNGIGINNGADIDTEFDGIVAEINNAGNLTVYNLSQHEVSGNIANDLQGGNVAVGELSRQVLVHQSASIWNLIGIVNTGSINADGDGIVAEINNTGNLELGGNLFGNVSGQVVTTAELDPEEDDLLPSGVHNSISITNVAPVWVDGVGMTGRITGNDTSGNITLSNSSRVVSTSGRAILFDGGDDRTLNLAAPAFLGGTIDLDGSAEVNITTGKSVSVLWTFDGEPEGGAPNVTGKVPYFYNPDTKTFATIDPTVFAAAYSKLTNMTGMLSTVIQRRVDGGGGPGAAQTASLSSPSNYASMIEKSPNGESQMAVPTADVPETDPNGALWMAINGGKADEDGTDVLNPIDSRYMSVTAGYDRRFDNDNLFGVLGGYVYAKSEVDSYWAQSYSGESEGAFLGLYGRYNLSTLFLDYALTGGALWNSDSRFVNDNLAALGNGSADADYSSWWLSPELGLGMQIAMGHDTEIIPSVRLRYAGEWFDSYSEDGARANADVDQRSIGVGEARAELAARQYIYFGSLTGRVGILGRTDFGGADADVTLIGQGEAIPSFTEDYFAGYAGLDLTMRPTESTRINFSGQATFGEVITSYEGTAQFSFEF